MKKPNLKTIIFTIALTAILAVAVIAVKGGGAFLAAKPDAAPQNVTVSEVRGSEAAISWITAEKTESRVLYGGTPALGSEKSAPGRTTAHLVTLADLTPNTTYYFVIGSASRKYALDGLGGITPYTLRTLASVPEVEASAVPSDTKTPDNGKLAAAVSPFGSLLNKGSGSKVLAEATGSGTPPTSPETPTTPPSGTPQTGSPATTAVVAVLSFLMLGVGARLLLKH